MTKWHGGKGDTARRVDKAKYDSNWDAIFSKKSPCTKVCKLEDGKCIGCGRTPDEIAAYGRGERND